MRDKMAGGVVPRCLSRRRYEGTLELPTDRLLPRTAPPKEIRFRIAGTALFWKQRVGEMVEGEAGGGGRTREGTRQDRIEQDQDPPRSNLALSHVRVIPFHPADEISPHLDSAYFAPAGRGTPSEIPQTEGLG